MFAIAGRRKASHLAEMAEKRFLAKSQRCGEYKLYATLGKLLQARDAAIRNHAIWG
jgi:hypothetical protein